jgi:hypothetical protein
MTGPFATETEASAAAGALGGPPEPGWSILDEQQRLRMLTRACEAAGVELGAYDTRILEWLANWEDGICGVVAGLITRAAAKGDDTGG